MNLCLGVVGVSFVVAVITLAISDKPSLQTWSTATITSIGTGLLSFALGRKTSK